MIEFALPKMALAVATVAMGLAEFWHGMIGCPASWTPKMENRGVPGDNLPNSKRELFHENTTRHDK